MKKIYIIAALLLSFSTVTFGATYDILNFAELNNGVAGALPNDIFQVRNHITSTSAINPVGVTGISVLGNHYIFDGSGNKGFTVLASGGLTVNFGNSVDSAIKNFALSSGSPLGGFAYNDGGAITITNSAFLDNISSDNIFADRGGLILYQNAGSGSLTNASFVNNGVSLTGITSDININGGLFKTDGGTANFLSNEITGTTISLLEDSGTAGSTTARVNGGIFNLSTTNSLISGLTVSSTTITADSVYGGVLNKNGGSLTFNASSAVSSITGTTISAGIIEGGVLNTAAGTTSLTSLNMNSNAVGTTATSTVNGGLINDSSSTFGYANSTANSNTVLGNSISGGLISSNASDSTNLSSLTITSNNIGNASTNTVTGGLIKDTSTDTFTLTGSNIGSSTSAALKNTITATTVDGALIKTNAQTVNITNNTIGYNVVNATDVNALVKTGVGATNATVTGNTIINNTINAVNDLSGGVLSSDASNLTFNGNAVTSNTLISSNGNIKGGLLSSTGTTSIGGNSSFSSNTITATSGNVEGGVFYNTAGGNLNVSSTTVSGNTITAGTNAKGGVVYNAGGNVTFSSSNLNASTITAGNNAYGGAIYNDNGGIITLNNTNLTNNTATGTDTKGGAIYNDGGTININSTGSSVTVSGNRVNGVSNAIYTNGGNINFNTGANTITLSDKIVSADSTTTMGIAGTSGSLTLNADLRDYTGVINFSGGILKVNSGAFYFTPLQTNILSSGLYDFKNGTIDSSNLGDCSMASGTTLSMWIDAALSGTGQIDHFAMNTTSVDPTAQTSIESIRLLNDLSDLATPLTLEYADKNINTVINTGSKAKLIFTPVSRYDNTVDSSAGTDKIVFTSAGADSGGLKNAIVSTDNNGIREFTLTTNETVTAWTNGNVLLGDLLFVDGQNKKVTTSNALPGIELNSANQLKINDVSEWSGFNSAKGGAIYNNGGAVVVTNSTFRNNQASRGGAIYQESGTLNFSGTITNNTATGNGPETAQGGGVYVAAGQTPTIAGTISSNSATSADAKGGGVYVGNGANISLGTVSSNQATGDNAQGGGIHLDTNSIVNSGAAVSNSATGINAKGGGVYVGTGAQASVAGLSSNTATGDNAKGGGAYNENVLTVTSNIQNNKALGTNAQGGGIYNNNGTVNVNGALTISGNVAGANIASATSNAIYSNGGILNFNGTGGINLNDRIFSTASSVLNTTGTINLNADSTGYVGAVNLNGGTVTLGNSGTFFNPTSTTVNVNTIFDSRNSKIDTNSFGAFDINNGSTLYLKLDADLNTKTLDKITSTSGTTPIGSVIISEVKVLTENQSTPPDTTFNIPFTNVGLNAAITSSTIFSNNYKYQVSVNPDKSSLDFLVTNVFSGLPEAVQYYHDIGQTNYPRFYATGDVDVTAWLNPQNGNIQQDSYIYIDGQHYSIASSNGITGIDISTLRQMDIVDVGSWTTNADGSITINKSWSGFNAHRGGALDNLAGTLSITNSAFSNNTGVNEGGTISNASTATLSVVNSLIANSQAGTKGGAIYNSSSDATITGTTLSSNTAGTSGGALDNTNSTATITNSIMANNTAGTAGGAISNTGTTSSITGSTFTNNQAGASGGAIYNTNSPTTISTSTFTQNRATGDGGAIYNANSTTTIANSTINSNQAAGNGGAIYNSSNMTITDTSFLNNKTTGANTKGGAIYNSGALTVTANNSDISFSGNTIANSTQKNALYMDGGSITLNTGAHSISFADSIMSKDNTSTMAINATDTDSNGDPLGNVNISSDVSDYKGNLALNGANLNFTNAMQNNTLLNLNGLTVSNSPLINTQNGKAQDANLGSATFNSDLRVRVDVNLQNKTMDRYLASSLTNPGDHNIIVEDLKILTPTTNWVTRINFVNSPLKDNVISDTVKVVYSPIYKYDLSYESQTGDYVFNYNGFSPNAYSGSVGAQVGGYINQLNTYDQVFTNLEMFMKLPKRDRLAIMYANKIASADTNSYNYLINHEQTKGLWFRPYSTFEKVPLKNGPNVSNIGYGAFLGGDTEMVSLGHGFEGLLSLYAGYNGSHQNYDGVGINQNGGTLGLTGTIYKGNFFGGLTVNAGTSSGEANSMFGMDSFMMFLSGVGMRTGYNFEMKNGKYILQPNLMMSYSYINTFDYTTATGVNITSTPLNVLHIEPGVRLIANLEDGWQPYIGVSVAGNVMGESNFQANDVSIPDLSVNPYVKYGMGVQKNWGKKLTGFAQTFITNGGRNGIGFQLALRWSL